MLGFAQRLPQLSCGISTKRNVDVFSGRSLGMIHQPCVQTNMCNVQEIPMHMAVYFFVFIIFFIDFQAKGNESFTKIILVQDHVLSLLMPTVYRDRRNCQHKSTIFEIEKFYSCFGEQKKIY